MPFRDGGEKYLGPGIGGNGYLELEWTRRGAAPTADNVAIGGIVFAFRRSKAGIEVRMITISRYPGAAMLVSMRGTER